MELHKPRHQSPCSSVRRCRSHRWKPLSNQSISIARKLLASFSRAIVSISLVHALEYGPSPVFMAMAYAAPSYSSGFGPDTKLELREGTQEYRRNLTPWQGNDVFVQGLGSLHTDVDMEDGLDDYVPALRLSLRGVRDVGIPLPSSAACMHMAVGMPKRDVISAVSGAPAQEEVERGRGNISVWHTFIGGVDEYLRAGIRLNLKGSEGGPLPRLVSMNYSQGGIDNEMIPPRKVDGHYEYMQAGMRLDLKGPGGAPLSVPCLKGDVGVCEMQLEMNSSSNPNNTSSDENARQVAEKEDGDVGENANEEEAGWDDLSSQELERKLAKVMAKISQLEARVANFMDMQDMQWGDSVVDNTKTLAEIDPDKWLQKTKRRIKRLIRVRHRLESLLQEREGGNVAWAECGVCGKERITVRIWGVEEEYTCGDEGTWANIKEGVQINCTYQAETDDDAETVPDEYLVFSPNDDDIGVRACLLDIDRAGRGYRAVFRKGCVETVIETTAGRYCMYIPSLNDTEEAGELARRNEQCPEVDVMRRYFDAVLERDYASQEQLIAALNDTILAYSRDHQQQSGLRTVIPGADKGVVLGSVPPASRASVSLSHGLSVSTRVIARAGRHLGNDLVEEIERLMAEGKGPAAVGRLAQTLTSGGGITDDTCAGVIRVFACTRRADCADVALQAIVESGCVNLSVDMVNLVLASYVRDPATYTQAGLADALSHIQLMHKCSLRPNNATFRLIVEACAMACSGPDNVGMLEAMDVPCVMEGYGLSVTRDILLSLLECSVRWMTAGKGKGAEYVHAVLERMQQDRMDPPSSADMDIVLTSLSSIREKFAVFAHWQDYRATAEAASGVQLVGLSGAGDEEGQKADPSTAEVLHDFKIFVD